MEKNANDVLTEMNNYPYFLFLSDITNISSAIAKLPWNCVLTTETDLDKVISTFQSEKRNCRCILSPEDFEISPLKKNQLTIVFLCGTKSLNSISDVERIKVGKNISKYFDYIPSLLSHFGYLLFDTWKLNDFTKTKIEELFLSLRTDSISVFGYTEDFPYSDELIKTKKISLCEDTFIDFFKDSDLFLYDESFDGDTSYSESRIDFFINKKRVSKDKNKFADFLEAFYLVTEQEINKIQVSSFLTSNFFYQFLQNSAYSYEWYGYSNGFNFKRDEDDQLYNDVKNKLKNPNNSNTYLIYGQSGSGKTIAINNIAHKIFKEKEYPVIYLKNSQFDFFKNTDNYNSVTSGKINSSFSLLDEFMHEIENAGSKNVLLVWDLSLPSSRDYSNIYLKLSKFLHNRGRNFVLLCSGYEEDNKQLLTQTYLNILSPYSESKVKSFLNYVKKFSDFSTSELKTIYEFFSSIQNEKINLFYIFYRFFYIVKPVITKGIKREAEFSIESVIKQCEESSLKPEYTLMQLAMIKAGIMKDNESKDSYVVSNDEIRQLLIITAICCKFNVAIPSDLALRLLENFDLSLIKSVTRIPFFRFSYDDDGDYSFSIRSQLEANILLQSLNISKEEIIDYICILIKTADLTSFTYKSNKEVKCIADLLHRMGPNSDNKTEFLDYYPSIISELKNLHSKNKKIDIRIIVIEINYIREFFCKKERDDEISRQDFNREMDYIISLGDSYSSVPDIQKDFNYNMIKIEIANARYYLFNKNYSSDINVLYIAKRDAESVFKMYGDYSYNIWFRTCLEIYKNKPIPELLVEMLNLINILYAENENIDTDIYMADYFDQVYSLLNESDTDYYIDSLIAKRNSVGLYLKVKKILIKNNIRIENIPSSKPKVEEIIKKIFSNILTEERKEIIYDSLECILLVIQLKWILYNHSSFRMGDKELTKLTDAQWNDISLLCEKYILLKNADNSAKSSVVIEYLQALCFAQMGQYSKANELLQNIKFNGQTYAIPNRVYTRHMLCNEKGEVRNFRGHIELTKDGNWRVNIPEFTNNSIPLYCKESNLRNINIEPGKVDSFFQVGIGIMGLSVYHGI